MIFFMRNCIVSACYSIFTLVSNDIHIYKQVLSVLEDNAGINLFRMHVFCGGRFTCLASCNGFASVLLRVKPRTAQLGLVWCGLLLVMRSFNALANLAQGRRPGPRAEH